MGTSSLKQLADYEAHIKRARETRIYGLPIADLTGDDLLAAIGILASLYEKAEQDRRELAGFKTRTLIESNFQCA